MTSSASRALMSSYIIFQWTKNCTQILQKKFKKTKPPGHTSHLTFHYDHCTGTDIMCVVFVLSKHTSVCDVPHEHVTKTSGCRSPWEQMFSSSCAVSHVRDAQGPLSVCLWARGFEQVVIMLSSPCVWRVCGSCPSELRDASAAFFARQKRDQGGRKVGGQNLTRKREWGDEASE